jgi:hypothetical protein
VGGIGYGCGHISGVTASFLMMCCGVGIYILKALEAYSLGFDFLTRIHDLGRFLVMAKDDGASTWSI